MRRRLIVALDVAEMAAMKDLVDKLEPWVDYFKVGSELFTRFGPEIIRYLNDKGKKVFLD